MVLRSRIKGCNRMMMYYLKSLRPVTAGAIIVAIAVILGACALHSRASDNNVAGRIHTSQPAHGEQVAVLAGGCFWAMQAMFSQLRGVDEVVPGYAGGNTPNPSYDEVCTHTTGY